MKFLWLTSHSFKINLYKMICFFILYLWNDDSLWNLNRLFRLSSPWGWEFNFTQIPKAWLILESFSDANYLKRRAGGVAQPEKCLSNKHEDLRLCIKNPWNFQSNEILFIIPMLLLYNRDWGQENLHNFWSYLTLGI